MDRQQRWSRRGYGLSSPRRTSSEHAGQRRLGRVAMLRVLTQVGTEVPTRHIRCLPHSHIMLFWWKMNKRTKNALQHRIMVIQPRFFKLIPGKHGEVYQVDNAMFDVLIRQPWYSKHGYAFCTRLGPMHRYVLSQKLGRQLLPSEIADHINRDRRDNRSDNLRIATAAQNAINASLRSNNSTGYKGVHGFRSKYRAMIQSEGQPISLGIYADAEEAAYVYDQFALALYGNGVYLNLLDG